MARADLEDIQKEYYGVCFALSSLTTIAEINSTSAALKSAHRLELPGCARDEDLADGGGRLQRDKRHFFPIPSSSHDLMNHSRKSGPTTA